MVVPLLHKGRPKEYNEYSSVLFVSHYRVSTTSSVDISNIRTYKATQTSIRTDMGAGGMVNGSICPMEKMKISNHDIHYPKKLPHRL